MDDLDGLADRIDAMEEALGGAEGVAAAFSEELAGLGTTLGRIGADAEALERALGGGLRRAIDGVALDGLRLSEALEIVGRSLANAAYGAAVSPVAGAVGGLLSGRVAAFAQGGVVAGATAFATRGGVGVMGEAGPEAIVPLARGPDGRLGIEAGGGRAAPRVTINVSTPDVAGFRRSRGQIAAELSRALAHGARNS